MIESILLPLDGSDVAECVLPHAAEVAKASKGELTLLHVLGKRDVSGESPIRPLDWQLCKAEAEAHLERAQQQLKEFGVSSQTVLLEGRAAERILEYAHQEDFALIILSSHGRSGLSGWNVSSVVQKIVYRARRSVMIVRAYRNNEELPRTLSYRRILLPLDGSRRAESVLPVGIALAKHHQAELLLTHVVSPPEMVSQTPLSAEDEQLMMQWMKRNQQASEAYFKRLQPRLTAVESRVRILTQENVSGALHRLVEEEEIDLVLLNAHGRSADNLQPYGSIVTNFIAYGTTPLLIFQDLRPDEIEPTKAEVVVHKTDTGPLGYEFNGSESS